ncbi:TPA: tail fiber assembly protein, partial [Salmonella enterica]|nr:tail fiber assembly protein [Salmonella enterica]
MKVVKNKKSEQFLNIKNFIPYTPESEEALFPGAAHLKSEDG